MTKRRDVPPNPLLVDPKTAAALLAISPRKLWELTNANQVPHLRIGRSVRYPVADLHAWVERTAREQRRGN